MNAIKSRIEKAYTKNELICICLNSINWQKRLIGYVRNIYPTDMFKIEIIDEYGKKQKTRSIPFKSVKSLEIGGVYNEKLEKLNKNGSFKNNSSPKYYSVKKRSLFSKLKLLEELKKLNIISTFFFNTEYPIGKIRETKENKFSIENIAYDGAKDGISIFDTSLLTKIRCLSSFENRISFLFKKAK
jgi:hypothetical protein